MPGTGPAGAWNWLADPPPGGSQTFAALAGLAAADDCGGNPACAPVDGKDAWPVLSGAAPAASLRTELLLGVGGRPPPERLWAAAPELGAQQEEEEEEEGAEESGQADQPAAFGTPAGGGFTGALRSGVYKLIAPGRQADGWSAQYPGTTAYTPPAAVPGAGSCTDRPCLFDLQADPQERKDLATSMPALAAKLFSR